MEVLDADGLHFCFNNPYSPEIFSQKKHLVFLIQSSKLYIFAKKIVTVFLMITLSTFHVHVLDF